MTDNL